MRTNSVERHGESTGDRIHIGQGMPRQGEAQRRAWTDSPRIPQKELALSRIQSYYSVLYHCEVPCSCCWCYLAYARAVAGKQEVNIGGKIKIKELTIF